MNFYNTSTGGSATFINLGGAISGPTGGETNFFNSSTAGNGVFFNYAPTASGVNATVATSFFRRQFHRRGVARSPTSAPRLAAKMEVSSISSIAPRRAMASSSTTEAR